jgi:hypothetical protein
MVVFASRNNGICCYQYCYILGEASIFTLGAYRNDGNANGRWQQARETSAPALRPPAVPAPWVDE